MTWRAVTLGLVVGGLISAWAYFNDHVIRQSWLAGNMMPVAVFGGLILGVLLVNPMLWLAGRRVALTTGEWLTAAAIATAACALPGYGLMRQFTGTVAAPLLLNPGQPAWQTHEVLSYVPGVSQAPPIAPAQVRDWPELARRLIESDGPPPDILATVWAELTPGQQQLWRAPGTGDRAALARSLNGALERLDQRRAEDDVRQRFLHVCGDLITPIPPGRGTLISSEQAAAALMRGEAQTFDPRAVPWPHVLPSLILWGGMALLLGGAGLCLAVIVHPQWSRHELLPYPIARLAHELCRQTDDSPWPAIARQRLFHLGLAGVLLLHVVNGLHAWFPPLPAIHLSANLAALAQLFPLAYRVPNSAAYFHPQVFPAVVGLGFLLSRPVSLSLGLSPMVWILLGMFLLSRGLTVSWYPHDPQPVAFLRLGAWLAVAGMVLYIGRAYYAAVARGAIGLGAPRRDTLHVTRAASWSARLALLLTLAAATLLSTAGLAWGWALMLVLFYLLIGLVLSRLVAEAGVFFVSLPFFAVSMILGLLGFEVLGPTAYIILAVASMMLIGDPREMLMPLLVNALRIADVGHGDGQARAGAARVAPWLAAMFVAGLVIAAVVTLTLQHQRGIDSGDRWANLAGPRTTFDKTAREMSELAAMGTDSLVVAASPLQRLQLAQLDTAAAGWLAVGAAATLVLVVARMRIPGWPLHWVVIATAGMWSVSVFAVSFLLAWLLKTAVTSTWGAAGYRRALPLMIGFIAGDLLGAVLWMIVGSAYFLVTGLTPVSYRVFP